MSQADTGPTELSEESVLLYLRELARDELELAPEVVTRIELKTPLVGGLNLDSLAQAVLIAEVEERYDFVFELEDRERLQSADTVGDFIQIILSRARSKDP